MRRLQWIEWAAGFETDACLPWPYSSFTVYGQTRPVAVDFNGRTRYPGHIVLALAVGPPPEGQPNALHSCRETLCVNKRHLRWGSQAENMQDKIKDGTSKRAGRTKGKKRCAPETVREIRRLATEGMSHAGISKLVDMGPQNVGYIVRGVTHKNVA